MSSLGPLIGTLMTSGNKTLCLVIGLFYDQFLQNKFCQLILWMPQILNCIV